MELDQNMEAMCAEACRCLDGLVDSDDSFDTYFLSYCIEHCPDWPSTKREELVFGVHMLAIIQADEILCTARSRPLTPAELDSADAYCDRREETEAYLAAIADQQATAEQCGVDVALIHTCRTTFVN
jgi:hypothetical protein